jgi:hypothetical protein
VPHTNHGSPVALPKFQMAPMLILLISSGSIKKELRYICLSEGRASHSQRLFIVYTEGNKIGHSIFSAWTERQYIKRIFLVA